MLKHLGMFAILVGFLMFAVGASFRGNLTSREFDIFRNFLAKNLQKN